MARRRLPYRFFKPQQPKARHQPSFILLDQFSVKDIHKWIAVRDDLLKYQWDYYKDFAYQRSKISDKIRGSILEAAEKTFKFEKWQRAVKYKYTLEPLSVIGSLIDPGGRFNIGDISPLQFPPFPALYLAVDKDTSFQELLCKKIDPSQKNHSLDLALTNPQSISVVSVSGSLDSVINLKEPKKLQPFIDLIKGFPISNGLKKAAKKIREVEPSLIQTVPRLLEALSDLNWRRWPMQFDVPATPQIFGQLVVDAGVEGILYTSKFTGKDCLAIFPQNFNEGSSVQLDDDGPAETKIRRLDSKNWNEFQKL